MMQRNKLWKESWFSTIRRTCFLVTWLVALSTFSSAQDTLTVVNGASFRSDQPLAAGSWVSGFGVFANVGEVFNSQLPLPKELGGVTVTVDGIEAPINYVSGLQINFVIPYETAPGLRTVVVNGPAGAVNGTVQVINAAPGIFKLDAATPPQGAILNEDFSLNGQDRPAIRGQAIQIYATGHAALQQQIDDGAAVPDSPLNETVVKPQVYVDGVECQVEFSGLAPGYAALWQINAKIPGDSQFSFIAGKVPVQVFMNGVDSNEVSIYVAQ